MKSVSASFVMSNSKVEGCPKGALPEYAFIGRSNVGKSSLINMLTNHKNLAKTSGRPGKTQLINHFLINKKWHLVDLPGYGYARASKSDKKNFQNFITQYFNRREQLVAAFVLVDIRHEPQPIDLEFMAWIGSAQIPFAIVFTKADKLKPQAIENNVDRYLKKMIEGDWASTPPHFITSSTNKMGREALLDYIEDINQSLTTV